MASAEAPDAKAKGAPSLDSLFKNKAKKKAKPVNLNSGAPEKPAAPVFVRSEGLPANPQWEREFHRDTELLQACGLSIKEVEADGGCLFRAFSDQLENDGGAKHLEYRERCVDFLESNRSDFEPFIEEDFAAYCRKMRRPAEWGGQVEVQALARAFGANALIHQPAERMRSDDVLSAALEVLTSDKEDARCVQLCFHPTHHNGQHYNSVRFVTEPETGSLVEIKRRVDDALRKPDVDPQASAAFDSGKPKAKVVF